jgi:hypothetical protein
MIRSLRARFEEKYMPEPNSGCWLWMAHINKWGYGEIWDNDEQHNRLAHRVSFTLHGGTVHNELLVCHTCDNPCCVNPAHLFIGTNLDNAKDRETKGRGKHIKGTQPNHANTRKTHCIHGHLFDEINTYLTKEGSRQCKPCTRGRERARRRLRA